MFTHQIHNTVGKLIYNAFLYKNVYYDLHVHKAFEILCVLDGEIDAVVNGEKYLLKQGSFILLPPFTPHSYKTPINSETFIVVLSEDYIQSFATFIKDKKPNGYSFTPKKEITDLVLDMLIGIKPELNGFAVKIEKPENDFTVKACAYLLVSEFVKDRTFYKKQMDAHIFQSIIDYLENNFTEDVSLKELSEKLGYNYSYTSRIFNEQLCISFNTLLNQFRIDYAKTLLTTSELSITEIAFKSGYNSIRNFNRSFKSVTGVTPVEFRNMQK